MLSALPVVRLTTKKVSGILSGIRGYSKKTIYCRGSSLVERSPEKAGVGSPILPPGTCKQG